MKLVYRGVKYEANLPVIAAAGKVIGKYRGVELHEQIVSSH